VYRVALSPAETFCPSFSQLDDDDVILRITREGADGGYFRFINGGLNMRVHEQELNVIFIAGQT